MCKWYSWNQAEAEQFWLVMMIQTIFGVFCLGPRGVSQYNLRTDGLWGIPKHLNMVKFWLWSTQHQQYPTNPLKAESVIKHSCRISSSMSSSCHLTECVVGPSFSFRRPRFSSAGSRHQIWPERTPETECNFQLPAQSYVYKIHKVNEVKK